MSGLMCFSSIAFGPSFLSRLAASSWVSPCSILDLNLVSASWIVPVSVGYLHTFGRISLGRICLDHRLRPIALDASALEPLCIGLAASWPLALGLSLGCIRGN